MGAGAIDRRITGFLFLLTFSLLGAQGRLLAAEDAPFTLPPSTQPDHIDFSSDHFDYDRSSSVVHLQGHVVLRQSTQTVRSQEIWIDLEKKKARATGYVQMEDGKDLMFGNEGYFDLDTGGGILKDSDEGFSPWRIHSVYAERLTNKDMRFWHAKFTSCNLDPNPHYYFRSSYMKVRPEKWMISWNDVFYFHRVPVFYTPFFWKSLRKKHILRMRLHFGNDHRNGAEVETFTLFDLSSSVFGRLLLDYYSKQGIGYGTELNYHGNKTDHGAMYLYRITETKTGLTRWTFQGDDFQTLTKSDALQMRLQAQSDPVFGNDYSRSSYLAVTPQLINSGALVHVAKWGTTRLSYSREDDSDPITQIYHKTVESAPRVDYIAPSFSLLKLPWLNNFNAFDDNTYARGQSFIQRTAGYTYSLTRTFPLLRGMSFVPNAGFNQTYIKQTGYADYFGSSRTLYDSFTNRYSASGDLHKTTFFGNLDLIHSYSRRMVPNTLMPDVLAADRGVEVNATTLSDAISLGRNLWFQTSSGYDYRTFRDHWVGFRDRVQPLTSDLNWAPAAIFNLQLHDQYQLNQGGQAAILQADLGERGGKFIGVGFQNTLSSASFYITSMEFGWKPSSGTWSAALVLRTLIHSEGGFNLDSLYTYAKELKVKKNWHDFHTELILRERPPKVKEFMVNLQLLFDADRPVVDRKTDEPGRLWNAEP